MLKFKACPRCRGDLQLERNEIHEAEVYCLQCGFRTFERVSTSREPSKRRAAPASYRSGPDVTRPRVPGDGRTRRGGVHRRVLAGV